VARGLQPHSVDDFHATVRECAHCTGCAWRGVAWRGVAWRPCVGAVPHVHFAHSRIATWFANCALQNLLTRMYDCCKLQCLCCMLYVVSCITVVAAVHYLLCIIHFSLHSARRTFLFQLVRLHTRLHVALLALRGAAGTVCVRLSACVGCTHATCFRWLAQAPPKLWMTFYLHIDALQRALQARAHSGFLCVLMSAATAVV
jgi:hypothetical protein